MNELLCKIQYITQQHSLWHKETSTVSLFTALLTISQSRSGANPGVFMSNQQPQFNWTQTNNTLGLLHRKTNTSQKLRNLTNTATICEFLERVKTVITCQTLRHIYSCLTSNISWGNSSPLLRGWGLGGSLLTLLNSLQCNKKYNQASLFINSINSFPNFNPQLQMIATLKHIGYTIKLLQLMLLLYEDLITLIVK